MEKWCHILTNEEVKGRFEENGLLGMHRLYDDDTESLIETPLTIDELAKDLTYGIKYGREFDGNYHGDVVKYEFEAYHDVMTFEDGYEERFYIGE